ncbi:MAG: GTP-binding protein [Candidatus Lokiarchaeota archaeon]|nr:GTP-binding protein [Candidatus Lokiarchaeota archaeon]
MIEGLIKGLIYIEFHDIKGTNPLVWTPFNLDEQLRILCGIKAVSLLTGEESYIPKELITLPFPSRNLKGMIKFLKWTDKARRGNFGRSALILLFHEADDLIFYKAKQYLENIFDEIIGKIINIEIIKSKKNKIKEQIEKLAEKIKFTLQELRDKELIRDPSKEFPSLNDLRDEVIDYKFKIVVCGDPRVGKTSTILRFTNNAFTRTYIPTLGVNVTQKALKIDEKVIKLVLWDIAGQSKFSKMRIHFYQGAEGVLLVFDLSNKKSFDSVRRWYKDIEDNLKGRFKIIGFLLGNKNDLDDKRAINKESAIELANELNLKYIETSALTGDNVKNMFSSIANEIYKTIDFY